MKSNVTKFFVGNLVLPIVLCLMGSIHPVALVSAQTTQTITLISGNGPIGSRDPANQFTLDEGVTWQDAYIIDTYSYYAIIPGTQFINRNPDFFGPEHAATWYRTHFVLPSGFSSPSLTVLVHADNVATIFLNGVQIGQQPFAETFLNFIDPPESFTATDQSLFQAGVNILEFDIYNFCCITAFDYKATVSFTSVLLCVQPPEGLVAWWPLDETTGTTAADIVGENDGTHVNGPIPVAGNVAGALRFDGIDDYVDLGSNSSLNIPGSVTIDAWVKFIGLLERSYSYFIADFGTGGWVSQLSLGIRGSGENFQFYAYEGRSSADNTYVYSSEGKTEGQWYHVAVVRDDTAKTIKLYVNGNVEASNSYVGKVPVSLQGHKYLGSSGPSYTDYFNGDLDEVEIYNRALSDSEIQAIFEAGSAGKCKGVVVNQPPVAQCKDVSVMADSVCTAAASIDNGSYDPENDPITLTQSPPGPYSNGNTLVTLTVSDDQGTSSQCTGTVTVEDNTPPAITSISVNPSVLWPPNHKMVPVSVSVSVSDNCDSKPVCKITSVSSNEPENGLGDGDTTPDWKITGKLTANLRAERSGNGNGRIYTLTITCNDTAGNSSSKWVTVKVPHDQGKK